MQNLCQNIDVQVCKYETCDKTYAKHSQLYWEYRNVHLVFVHIMICVRALITPYK